MSFQSPRAWPGGRLLIVLALGVGIVGSPLACEADASSRTVKTFQEYIALNAKFVRSVTQEQSLPRESYTELRNAVEAFHETQILPALEDATQLVCERGDREVLSWLMRLVVAASNSASEAHAWTLGEMFLCRSELVAELHAQFPAAEQEFLTAQLKWGIRNVMYGRPEEEIQRQLQKVDAFKPGQTE